MKAYVLTTGLVFASIVAAHVARLIAEGPGVAADPFFIVMTVIAIALCVWSWRVWARLPRI